MNPTAASKRHGLAMLSVAVLACACAGCGMPFLSRGARPTAAAVPAAEAKPTKEHVRAAKAAKRQAKRDAKAADRAKREALAANGERARSPKHSAAAASQPKAKKAGKRGALAPSEEPKREPRTLEDFRALVIAEPQDPRWPYFVAEKLAAEGSREDAERSLRDALKRDPAHAPSLALLTKWMYDTGRHAEAVQLLEAARARAGKLVPELVAGLALHQDALDQPDQAAALLASIPKAERVGGGSALVYVLLRGATPDSARELAEEALDRKPRSAVNQNNAGIVRLRAGDADGARKAFEKAIDLDPELPGPYYNLAILEKFYVFDDDAAARWFALYRKRSGEDPDGLASVFSPAPTTPPTAGRNTP